MSRVPVDAGEALSFVAADVSGVDALGLGGELVADETAVEPVVEVDLAVEEAAADAADAAAADAAAAAEDWAAATAEDDRSAAADSSADDSKMATDAADSVVTETSSSSVPELVMIAPSRVALR